MVPKRVFLVGPMGAGKSSIGRHLARQLGFAFVDSDAEIEARCGADIPWIFDVEGESGFRDREQRVIEELTARERIVLASGGGAVLRPRNRQLLASRGYVVYLAADAEELARRTGRDRRRPLLQQGEPAEVLARLLRERDALYREIADTVFETGRLPPHSVAQRLAEQLREVIV